VRLVGIDLKMADLGICQAWRVRLVGIDLKMADLGICHYRSMPRTPQAQTNCRRRWGRAAAPWTKSIPSCRSKGWRNLLGWTWCLQARVTTRASSLVK